MTDTVRQIYPVDLVQLVSFLARVAAVKRNCYVIIDSQGLHKLQEWFSISYFDEKEANKVMGFPIIYIPQSNVNICIIIEDENTKPVIDQMIELEKLYLKSLEVPF